MLLFMPTLMYHPNVVIGFLNSTLISTGHRLHVIKKTLKIFLKICKIRKFAKSENSLIRPFLKSKHFQTIKIFKKKKKCFSR